MRNLFSSTSKVVVALFLSLFMTNFAPVMTAYATPQPWTEPTNHVEYWQNLGYGTCTKIDNPGGTSYTLGAPANGTYWSLLVVKAAQENEVYQNPQSNVAYDAPLNQQGEPRGVSHVIFCYKPTPSVEVTPAAPTYVDPCGTADDKYTIPATTGVIYKVNGQVTAAGTYNGAGAVAITAEAATGYTLTGTKAWDFDFTNVICPIIVTPGVPSPNDVCGTANDTYTIPSTTGVVYKVNGNVVSAGSHSGTGTVVVTAEADSGYVLTPGTYSWTFDFTDVACDVDVIPAAPTHNDVCETANDTYTIPATTGVSYKVNGQVVTAGTYNGTGSVTVTAETTGAPYILNGTTNWTFNFTNVSCGHVLGDTTTPTPTGHILSTSTNVPSVLPATGGTSVPTGLLPLVGAVATYLIAYNRSTRKNAKA